MIIPGTKNRKMDATWRKVARVFSESEGVYVTAEPSRAADTPGGGNDNPDYASPQPQVKTIMPNAPKKATAKPG